MNHRRADHLYKIVGGTFFDHHLLQYSNALATVVLPLYEYDTYCESHLCHALA